VPDYICSMEYKRPVLNEIKARLSSPKGFIQVITGPRQVGKTTLVKQLFASTKWVGIYHVAEGSMHDGAWVVSVFNEAVLRQRQNKRPVVLALDEIQKVPNWSAVIKRLYDKHMFSSPQPIRLVLLGSSQWLMQRGLSESLAGRFEQWNIPHWTFNELSDAFSISRDEYAYFGGYPGAMEMRHDEARWRSYVRSSLIETVITEDVLLMERIEKPAVLRKVFELGSSYSGQIFSNNGGEVRRKTIVVAQ
jgi:uncharacterized protein